MKKSKVYALCEGAIMVALATALSYVKLMELPQGGSVCIGMLPLFIYFYRWDWKHSFLAAFAYGLLQLIFDGAYAWGPTSMLLDYVLAFTVLGVATFFRKMKGGLYLGATVACVCRFLVHFISGVTIYRINEPTELFNSIYTNREIFLRELVGAGNAVVVPTPAYMPFLSVPKLYDVDVIEIEMLQGTDETTGEREWLFDFDAIERAFAAGCHAFVLCNPHNPIGKVLTLAEEQRLCELAERYDVRIFNDEIHAPFVFEGRHIPYPTISEAAARQSMTATSASKSFNIPGTKCAQVLLTNPADREMWAERAEWSEHQTATIGAIATTTAYNEGDPWFQDALSYVRRNLGLFDEQMSTRFSGVGYIRPRGTYIAWLDFGPLGIDDPAAYFLEKAKVALTDGRSCGRAGAGCARVNMAMPYPLLEDCLNRMHDALQADGLL